MSTRRARLQKQISGLRPQKGRDGGLYDAILDAYHELSRDYRPGMLNEVLVFTGGATGEHDKISLDRLVTELQKDFGPEQQVNITLLAFGKGIDMAPLKRIAAATEGAAYNIKKPDQQTMTLFRCATALRVQDDLHCSQ